MSGVGNSVLLYERGYFVDMRLTRSKKGREIIGIKGREILDSRGNPTVEVEVELRCGVGSISRVPSGASTGRHECVEVRDGDGGRYGGKGVLKAVNHINGLIGEELMGMDILEQGEIDKKLCELDGTVDKSGLGANSLLGVSLGCCGAGAEYMEVPVWRYIGGLIGGELPVPMVNILNGGKHGGNGVEVQEYMIIPMERKSIREEVRVMVEIFQSLKGILKGRGYGIGVGDEGGYAPFLSRNEEGLELIMEAIGRAGYKPGEEVGIGLDVASSEFYDKGKKKYIFKVKSREGLEGEELEGEELEGEELEGRELIDIYEDWTKRYPIISIEDGMGEDDWEGWIELTGRIGSEVQLVGDDIFVTNKERLREGIQKGVGNAILIKVNQIGTLTETIEVLEYARSKGYRSIISHRSGETEDTMIADLSVGLRAGQIKTGSVSRGERTSKYNRLFRIEEELGRID